MAVPFRIGLINMKVIVIFMSEMVTDMIFLFQIMIPFPSVSTCSLPSVGSPRSSRISLSLKCEIPSSHLFISILSKPFKLRIFLCNNPVSPLVTSLESMFCLVGGFLVFMSQGFVIFINLLILTILLINSLPNY